MSPNIKDVGYFVLVTWHLRKIPIIREHNYCYTITN